MSDGPGRLTLEAELEADGMGAATAAALAACRGAGGFSQLLGWRAGETGPLMVEGLPGVELTAATIEFASGAEHGLVLPADAPGRFAVALNWRGTDGAHEVLAAMVAVVTSLAARRVLRRALVQRLLGGHCLPALKLVEAATHLLACPPDEIDRAYADVQRFAAAWDRLVTRGGIGIHTRALDDTGNPDFLRRVLPGHMAMARLARPGGVQFYAPRFAEGEFEVLNAGEPTLTGIGYHAVEQVYEFAGHTPPGTELRCIDLLNAWRIASDGRIDGHPVREVRAVFMDAEQAARAAPLLHAAGVSTWWEDEAGQLRRFET